MDHILTKKKNKFIVIIRWGKVKFKCGVVKNKLATDIRLVAPHRVATVATLTLQTRTH